MSQARASFELVSHISEETRAEMYRLFSRYYVGVSDQVFSADLADKEQVLMVREGRGKIVGFSTIAKREIRAHDGVAATAVFSGDTVMDKAFWGAKILQWEFTRYLFRQKLSAPHRRLYWMLMSKGFKTYLMVRRNCPRTFPGVGLKDDRDLRFVRDAFYAQKYPGAFDPKTGLVRLAALSGAVAPAYAGIDGSAKKDPDVAFFLEHNPDYRLGVELACVAEVRLRDFPVALAKYVGRAATQVLSGSRVKKTG